MQVICSFVKRYIYLCKTPNPTTTYTKKIFNIICATIQLQLRCTQINSKNTQQNANLDTTPTSFNLYVPTNVVQSPPFKSNIATSHAIKIIHQVHIQITLSINSRLLTSDNPSTKISTTPMFHISCALSQHTKLPHNISSNRTLQA